MFCWSGFTPSVPAAKLRRCCCQCHLWPMRSSNLTFDPHSAYSHKGLSILEPKNKNKKWYSWEKGEQNFDNFPRFMFAVINCFLWAFRFIQPSVSKGINSSFCFMHLLVLALSCGRLHMKPDKITHSEHMLSLPHISVISHCSRIFGSQRGSALSWAREWGMIQMRPKALL